MRVETIGRATLYCGDSRELIEAVSFDTLITDPPYGVGFKYEGYDDTADNLSDLIAGVIIPAIMKAKRAAITPGTTNLHKYPAPLWTCAWTWDTTTALGKCGWSQWQPILFYGEDVVRGFGKHNGILRSDRIHFSGGQAQIDKQEGEGHTCPKPTKFMQRMVARFSNLGETVLDPFLGSGTTGAVAVTMGRDFIGIEREPKYFDIACDRIDKAQRQGDLFIENAA